MAVHKKQANLEKEKKLLEKIEKAKKDLSRLRKKRVVECGELVAKYGLDQYDNTILSEVFEKLADRLKG